MAKFSTGLRTAMLNESSFKDIFNGICELRIYNGAVVPASADLAETGEVLMVLTADGDDVGLSFGTASEGVIHKAEDESWSTTSVDVSGRCKYFRLVLRTDDGSDSTSLPRVQGTCGLFDADMILTAPDAVDGTPWGLNYFSVALPTN